MSRAATATTLTDSAVDERVQGWGKQLATLQKMQADLSASLESLALQKAAAADELARALLPVAESMTLLTEETRQTLEGIVAQSRSGHAKALAAIQDSTEVAKAAASSLTSAMLRVEHQVSQFEIQAREAREAKTSPWGPAIVAALIPLTAVLWLAWRLGALRP
ncbi:MAG: hypothetical protein RQ966_16240 [Acetobacteraceae bacterium]|nr:hypothetical protein [Acetobacteraceae bacterium]